MFALLGPGDNASSAPSSYNASDWAETPVLNDNSSESSSSSWASSNFSTVGFSLDWWVGGCRGCRGRSVFHVGGEPRARGARFRLSRGKCRVRPPVRSTETTPESRKCNDDGRGLGGRGRTFPRACCKQASKDVPSQHNTSVPRYRFPQQEKQQHNSAASIGSLHVLSPPTKNSRRPRTLNNRRGGFPRRAPLLSGSQYPEAS